MKLSFAQSIRRLCGRKPAHPSADHSRPLMDGPSCRNRHAWAGFSGFSAVLTACLSLATGTTKAGDILRGGAPAGSRAPAAGGTGNGPAAAEAARAAANAKDALARTSQALKSVQDMQAAARKMAQGKNSLGTDPNHPGIPLPTVPNGLTTGGLQVAPGATVNSTLWQGANLPEQSVKGGRTEVNIKQTTAQAVLNWKTFNVGKETTVTFDQSAGGAQKGQWIAFNKINDPSGVPSQILGQIKADGQVYLVNPNGIIFGGASQVNLRTLVASSLPINDNLIKQGLLNNRDSQFLFSALPVAGGADGTPAFIPSIASTPTGRPGDVIVQMGAQLNSALSGDGNGGRVMLVGSNVKNEGTISTPAGQTIMAAGLQVATSAHASTDPSLRGLDVWVGAVDDASGVSTNTGLINTPTGSATMAGRSVNQLGVIESSTSVTLNGRIDLLASYGAVGNPNFDNTGAVASGGPQFLFQHTGTVTLGNQSVTEILPDYTSPATTPGTSLPQKSQINLEGLVIRLKDSAMVLAPNADVSIRAGVWPYQDANGDRTIFGADGLPETGVERYFTGAVQKFLFSDGQISLAPSAFINVAGSTDVFVALAQNVLKIQLRGPELADSPLQRNGPFRNTDLTVDLRRSGVIDGRYWVGTPLGDVTGVANAIQHNAAQLTAAGGTITMQAGQSIVLQNGSKLNVSGGYFQNEGGIVQTSRLLKDGNLVEIYNAQPGVEYDGIYTGLFDVTHSRWGVTDTYTVPWMTNPHYEQGYVQGANGGKLTITAASMALDGEMLGLTVEPPRGRASLPAHSQVSLAFTAETTFGDPTAITFLPAAPTPPSITFNRNTSRPVPDWVIASDVPVALPAARLSEVFLSPDLLDEQGFGSLTVTNPDGGILVPADIKLAAPVQGAITLTGSNVTISGKVSAPGGKLSFTAYNISPAAVAAFPLVNAAGAAAPLPDPSRGKFTLNAGASLSAAGLVIDDRLGSPAPLSQPLLLNGGSVTIQSFDANLTSDGRIDVSGGVAINSSGRVSYGNGGSITIRTGKDPGFARVLGGHITLHSELLGYSGATGGALTIQAGTIQIGGTPRLVDTLLLQPEFFRTGGFTSYTLEGIGALASEVPEAGDPQAYIPGVLIAPGTVIEPIAESLVALPHSLGSSQITLAHTLKDVGLRSPTSLTFSALGGDDPFTTDILEARGDVVFAPGARIVTDPGASVTLKGQTVTALGSITAPGGTITLQGAAAFPVAPDLASSVIFATPTVYVGPQARLSTAGVARYTPDAFGRRLGTLLAGGTISISGNIVAEAGAIFDVSGAEATFDVHPTALGNVADRSTPVNSGLNSPLYTLRSIPYDAASNGGKITLAGSEMLLSDATLLGRAGGATATGGTLEISSGRYYPAGNPQFGSDINLVVTQHGLTFAPGKNGVGRAVSDVQGNALPGMGYFTVDRFAMGGFDSLDLGFSATGSSGVSVGGNIEFRGPVAIDARGYLRVAGGGVMLADAPVRLSAPYIAIGQAFKPPLNPDDSNVPFVETDPSTPGNQFFLPPTFGPGSVNLSAQLIDVGNLVLRNIGRATLTANNGDIRGNGSLNIAGDLILQAGQIYPTTLATFDIYAFDHNGIAGSVTIQGSGSRTAPLSAGGHLNVFASKIVQGGVLRAPFGSITLGWDGTDFDPSDADFDTPTNAVVGASITTPTTQEVVLKSGSTTSVSAWSGNAGAELLIPFGLSPDGTSWIDPSGVNVTINGLPQKRITIGGNSVRTDSGSVIDVRGGGDLYAYRFTAGNGGSIDLLGTASGPWQAGTEYQSGDLVTSGGKTWSARVRNSDVSPAAGTSWTEVPDSYAIVPSYDAEFAPYAPSNTGLNASALAGDPGYVSGSLQLGERIYLEASPGLAAGFYTLLPRRYALLPGAFLVTPKTTATLGTVTLPEGASIVAGYTVNQFDQPSQTPTLRSSFEVAPPAVLAARAAYDSFVGDTFFPTAAQSANVTRLQELARDAGYVAFSGNNILQLGGYVMTKAAPFGHGAAIDISSSADIYVIGNGADAPAGSTVVLDTERLNSWGAESLLIGGLRRTTDAGTVVDVRTSQLTVDAPGGGLAGPDITLVSKAKLTVADNTSIETFGEAIQPSLPLLINGDGTLLRVSTDPQATLVRTGTTNATGALLTIGAGTNIQGFNVILDSTYGTALDPNATIQASVLNLGSGQISIVLDPTVPLTGSVVPQHLVLEGQLLQDVQQVSSLTLRSYTSIDLYGAGTFGRAGLERLALQGSGLRGYGQGTGTTVLEAGTVIFSNPSNIAQPSAPATTSGTLQVEAGVVQFGANTFSTTGYADVVLQATGGVLGDGTGSFTTPGNLTIRTPQISGTRNSNQKITAGGALVLESSARPATITGGLGAILEFVGDSVSTTANITLPSGQITLHATGAGQNVSVAGTLDVSGVSQEFYDVTRYSDGGNIKLIADGGDVNLLNGSLVSVAAPAIGGNAGVISVKAAQGAFHLDDGAAFRGEAASSETSGSFALDAGTLPSYDDLNLALNAGGFFEQRNLRIRTGDLTISNPGGQANVAREFIVSTDTGSILVTGTIDVSGQTGGKISLIAGGNLTVASGAILAAHAADFSNAGQGGEISLEAGAAVNGVANLNALLDLQAGSTIDLGVDTFVPGAYTAPGSSAFYGQFTGTLHLRAPRNAANTDLGIAAIGSTIQGASTILVEGYQVVDLTASGGLITGWRTAFNALPTANTVQRNVYNSANSFLSTANYNAMMSRLLGADAQGLTNALVLAPGVEIINRTGNLTLGQTNGTSLGSATLTSADWNLSDFRFGPKQAPGVLTLRAAGDIVFNNALSDGFTPVTPSSANGNSSLWLGQLKNIDPLLPTNTQSWSYRLTAGADFSGSNFTNVRDLALLGTTGSIIVGQYYAPIPNSAASGASPGVGSTGLTANSIRISTTATDLGTRFEVIRTGTGSITVTAGRDVQLRNQFATIYTAGVRIPNPQNLFGTNDFRPPTSFFSSATHPDQGQLGVPQQYYGATYVDEMGQNRRIPQWSLAGGEIMIEAGQNIGRYYAQDGSGNPIIDSSRQLPSNWLNRSGYVDPNTGLFGSITADTLVNPSVSTAWWIDYSNFFEGVGALGGGDVSVIAGGDIVNIDAVIPTNARMQSYDPLTGLNAAPDASKLVELGGGDLLIRSGHNIDGGVYYVERGDGILSAGNQITTNSTRSPSFGILSNPSPVILDSKTWLPTTLFLGKGGFEVTARGDILLGPVVNAFLLPAGLNNKAWYRTQFSTYADDSSVDVASFGGSVTHRLEVTLPGRNLSEPILQAWMETQNLFTIAGANTRASYYQPWIRLAETDVARFATVSSLLPPVVRSTAFAGDINIVGSMNLFPSATGTLEFAASGGVIGLQPTGIGRTSSGVNATAWTSATINVSDADPASINSIVSPSGIAPSGLDFLSLIFNETGSFTGNNAAAAVKEALHAASILHQNDPNPVRLYASSSDITGLTLFSPKAAQILAGQDITDVAFYVQNTAPDSISIVSAGRDIILYNENSTLRTQATNLATGNFIAEVARPTVVSQGGVPVSTLALAGDIQINGPGTLEVLAGRNIDLGTGANLTDGTGVGITSVGNSRNPGLSFDGSDLIVLAGVPGPSGTGAAAGLAGSSLDFSSLIDNSATSLADFDSLYLSKLGATSLTGLTPEQTAIVALEMFYRQLRDTGRNHAATGSYDPGLAAIAAVFGNAGTGGEMFTRARDIRTTAGGAISLAASGGGLTMASDIFGNPNTPPGIVTEYGGPVSIFTDKSVDIGQARIFTLRGGDMLIWSTTGDIAAGTASRTVVTAPPTRVIIDSTSADVKTDLGGLATGGGIGVLASVEGIAPGVVDLVAPNGAVDAGDAGIRATGQVNIAAVEVRNAGNINAPKTSGVPSTPQVAAPNLGALTSAASTAGAQNATANNMAQQQRPDEAHETTPSIISVEVLGYGGGSALEYGGGGGGALDETDENERDRKARQQKIKESQGAAEAVKPAASVEAQ